MWCDVVHCIIWLFWYLFLTLTQGDSSNYIWLNSQFLQISWNEILTLTTKTVLNHYFRISIFFWITSNKLITKLGNTSFACFLVNNKINISQLSAVHENPNTKLITLKTSIDLQSHQNTGNCRSAFFQFKIEKISSSFMLICSQAWCTNEDDPMLSPTPLLISTPHLRCRMTVNFFTTTSSPIPPASPTEL